ncbi:DUF1330 domain-containing protein [Flavobacteriaceae bacterium 3-367]|uniref:DUF1330 domain-containing protein n=1 Tax=Eudoraea algarum TaxID=3417568 RepID=UPI00328F6FE2
MNFKIFLIIIGFVNPQERESFDHYATNMRTLYETVDATVVEKYPIAQTIVGDEKPDFIMVVEFPSQEAFVKLFSSEEYKKLVPYREKGFKKLEVFVSKK